jgi:proteasome lid subunit RPN8/RPN11
MKDSVLIISKEHIEFIGKHGEEAYPHEACGIILGHIEDNKDNILFITKDLKRAKNLSDNPLRFYLDPKDFLRIQEEADKEGLEIIGIYHTHPDHPPIASQYDLESAIEGLFYLILSILGGKPANFKGWVLDQGSRVKKFVESEVRIIE